MDENMGDRESISPLRDSGLPQPIESWMSISSPEVKCYMTDIVVERVLNTTNQPNSTPVQMKVELLNNTTDEGEILLLKKISPSEWKYDRIIELTHEVTFKAPLDDMGRVASVKLGETEVEKFRSITGLTETAHNSLIEQEDRSMFRLTFQIVSIPLDGRYLKETFTDIMKKDSKRLFSMIQDLPDHMINKPIFLDECGAYFLKCFRKSRRTDDIDNSILANRLALQLTAAETLPVIQFLNDSRVSLVGSERVANLNTVETARSGIHLQLPSRLNNTGVSLRHRFEVIDDSDPAVIMEAISLQQRAVQLTPEGHGDMPNYLIGLAQSLQRRFVYTKKLADIDEAISFQQRAVRLTPESHADMASYLSELGDSFDFRHRRTRERTDFLEAISFHQKAVQHTQESDQNMAEYLYHIAGLYHRQYLQRTGEPADVSAAISLRQKIIQLTSEGHENMARFLCDLGESHRYRFLRTGEPSDISEAISFYQKAVQHTREGDQNMPQYLHSLALALQQRYLLIGELADISAAISFQRKAIQLNSDPEDHSPYLLELAESLQYRFSCTGELMDISEAISVQRKVVQNTPEGHRNMLAYLSALVSSLQIRFQRTGELVDISEAISWQQKAVQVPPEGINMGFEHVHLSFYALGDTLRQRSLHTGELRDISEAISFQQKLVQLTPEGDRNMPFYLFELGGSLRYRFSRTGELTDISEAISLQRKAVQLTPEGHENMCAYFAGLGVSLQQRFICTGELADISEAISLQRKGIQLYRLIRPSHKTVPIHYLSDLGVSLRHRFISTRELTDIFEAISLQQEAVQLTPDDHPNIARFLSSLACSLSSRFNYTGDITDINMAISKLSIAANSNYGSPSIRLNAAKNWIEFAQKFDPSQLLDAHRSAILLIPYLAGLEQTIEKRHNNLVDISTLSASAAAAAFASERTDLALEWLEQGRCLVWSQLNNLRTPLETLRSHDPKIADEVRSVSRALENAGSRGVSSLSITEANMLEKSSLQDEIAAHVKLAQQWDQLLATVRSIPGLEDFLKPSSAANLLRNLPNLGVVILINVHQDRCDALALRSGIEPLHIALPEISYAKANSLRTDLKIHLLAAGVRMRESKPRGIRRLGPGHGTSLQQILATLWFLVVKPILNGLGYSEPPRDLMRIWWCVSGPLAFLPIHAAGIYDGSEAGTTSALSDFAISSYTSTVRALIDSMKSPREFDKGKSGLFMVSQPDTPHLPYIPGTTEEVRRVEKKLTSRDVRVLHLDSAAATVDRGIGNMKAYSCVHFACHAQQNTKTPLKSGFSFYDGQLELSSIIQQNLVGADLAFLSACQTSAGDERLSEEAVHLAAGMLAAGYRGAVATMWSIRDEYGPIIAEDFYSNLTQNSGRLSGEHAARALHHATQNLRKSLGDSESALLIWVPYVHFGL